MATLGNASVFSSDTSVNLGDTLGVKHTMPADGWLESLHVYLDEVHGDGNIDYRIVTWDASRNQISLSATATMGQLTAGWRAHTYNNPIRKNSGDVIYGGYFVPAYETQDLHIRAAAGTANDVYRYDEGTGNSPADPLAGTQFTGTKFSMYFDYTANVAPTTPTWRSPANGATVNNNPTVEGNLNQGADASLDTIDQYDFQLWVSATGVFVQNTTYNTTTTERNQGYFSRSLGTLTPGTSYTMRFRTVDSWGSRSADWSAERSFTITAASDAPVLTSPINDAKLNTLSGYNYVFQHSHPQNLQANGYQILVKNAAGSTLFDSGAVTLGSNVANGGTITVAEFHADLTYNTDYQWQARTRDTNNNFGPYSSLASFHTNRAPNPPANLSPANNASVGSPTFTASATDPDGDPIATAQIEIAVVSTGATVAGYPASMVVGSGGVLNYTPPGSGTGSLTLGTAYKWRARANDGLGAGDSAWSEWAFFTYAALPTVSLIGPRSGRVNSFAQPSAEYDPANLSGNFWLFVNDGGVGQSLTRVQEDSSPYGSYQWQGVVDGSGELRLELSTYLDVNESLAQVFSLFARTISGSPTLTFEVLAHNASNTLLGTLIPTSIGTLNATVPPTTWTRYGGVIGQIGSGLTPVYPAGSTKVDIQVTATGTGTFALDALAHDHMPTNPTTTTERDQAADWYGYADGDSINFRDVDEDYAWTGATGDSPSSILAVLTKPTAQNVVIKYTHGVAKGNDRLIIQKWIRGEWVEVHDSNPTWSVSNGARTSIPLPTNVIENEATFRLKVQVRDTSSIQGETDWVTFDVFYAGPAQLDITIAEAEPWAARVYLSWAPSALGVVFAGAEIQRIDPTGDEDPAIIGIVTNVNTSEFYDHYPQSGKLYTYRIRQREQVGADQTTSFWSSVQVECNYSPYVFLKDTEDPTLFTAYDTAAENLIGYDEDAPIGVISPWGAERPTVLTRSKLRIRTGEVTGAFFTDAGIEIPGFLDRDTLLENAKTILKRRNTVCILTTQPDPAKLFAAIVGPARVTYPHPPNVKGIEFPWQEVSFSEDIYEREGII